MKVLYETDIGEYPSPEVAPEFPNGRQWRPGKVTLTITETASPVIDTLGKPVQRVALVIWNQEANRPGLIVRLRRAKGILNCTPGRQLGEGEWEIVRKSRALILDYLLNNPEAASRIKEALQGDEDENEGKGEGEGEGEQYDPF